MAAMLSDDPARHQPLGGMGHEFRSVPLAPAQRLECHVPASFLPTVSGARVGSDTASTQRQRVLMDMFVAARAVSQRPEIRTSPEKSEI